MGFLGNIFGKKKAGETFFSEEEMAEMEVKNKQLAEERQQKIELESEFKKFSDGIDDFFYEKLAVELDESVLTDFTMFCVKNLNSFPDPETKKVVWGLIREYVLDMYKKETGDEIALFLDSAEGQVLR